jgi:transposase InsO family protein
MQSSALGSGGSKYTERLPEAGIEPSAGSAGDSSDNTLAEAINGLYKTEVFRRQGPWRSLEAAEYANRQAAKPRYGAVIQPTEAPALAA